jgi:hypothetical protein
VSRFEVLSQHYSRLEAQAYERYLEAREAQAYEWHRGVLAPEDYYELSAEVEQHRESYEAALTGDYCRYVAEYSAQQLALVKRSAQHHEALEAARHESISAPVTDSLEPPLERLCHSLTSHGPPRVSASITELLSG